MPANNPVQLGFAWFYFAMLTVFAWGLYGNFLHTGQIAMADPENGRYKAFLFVGVAYFITAVLAPLLVLKLHGSRGSSPSPECCGLSLRGSWAQPVLSASCWPSGPRDHRQSLWPSFSPAHPSLTRSRQ